MRDARMVRASIYFLLETSGKIIYFTAETKFRLVQILL